MRKSKICLICLISLIMLAWGASNGDAQITVTVANIQTQQDSVINVPVTVSDLSGYGIISYQFRVVYDSTIIKAIGVSTENTLTAPWGNPAANVASSGIMVVGAFGVTELSQGDTLINLVFDVVAHPGDSSHVLLEAFQFNGNYPQAIVVNGAVKIVLPTKIVNENSQVMPRNVQLVSNYPEPFQTRTAIVIKNSGADHVQILIFNLLGQKIKQVGTYNLKPGDLKVEWDATDDRGIRAPAGVYFCVVKNEEKIVGVERMILIE